MSTVVPSTSQRVCRWSEEGGCRGVGGVFGLSGWPAFRGVSMEVWSQCKPGLLSVFLDLLPPPALLLFLRTLYLCHWIARVYLGVWPRRLTHGRPGGNEWLSLSLERQIDLACWDMTPESGLILWRQSLKRRTILSLPRERVVVRYSVSMISGISRYTKKTRYFTGR